MCPDSCLMSILLLYAIHLVLSTLMRVGPRVSLCVVAGEWDLKAEGKTGIGDCLNTYLAHLVCVTGMAVKLSFIMDITDIEPIQSTPLNFISCNDRSLLHDDCSSALELIVKCSALGVATNEASINSAEQSASSSKLILDSSDQFGQSGCAFFKDSASFCAVL